MNTLKHILQNYEAKLDDKIDYLVEAGLFEEKKVGMLKRAINKNPNNLTMAESKVLKEFVDNVVSQLLYEKQDHLAAYDKKMNKNKNVDKELPVVIILKRKAIRVYPDNQKVALYYSQALDRYISIPYGPKGEALGMTMNESIDTKVNPQDSNKIPSANPKSPSEREMKKDVDTSDILKNMQKNEPVNPRMDFAPSADPKMRIDEVSQQMATRAYKKGAENIKSIENDPNLDAVQKTIRISKIKQKMEMLSHRMKTNVADVKTGNQVRSWAGDSAVKQAKRVDTQPKPLSPEEEQKRFAELAKTDPGKAVEMGGFGRTFGALQQGRFAHDAGLALGLGIQKLGSAAKLASRGNIVENQTSFRKNLNLLREQQENASSSWKDNIKDFATGMIPFVDAYKSYKEGDYAGAAGNLALDAATLTGGGLALKALGKGAIKTFGKGAVKATGAKTAEKLATKYKGRVRRPDPSKGGGKGGGRGGGKGGGDGPGVLSTLAGALSQSQDSMPINPESSRGQAAFSQTAGGVVGRTNPFISPSHEFLMGNISTQAYGGNQQTSPYSSQATNRYYQNESNLSLIKKLSKSKSLTEQVLPFGESSVTINKGTAKKVMKVYNTLNESNKKKMENMLSESATSFKKAIQFAVRH